MTKNIYYVIFNETTGEELAHLGTYHTRYIDAWNPCDRITSGFYLGVNGRTYQARKEDLRNKAVEFSNNQAPGLDLIELEIIWAFFEKYGRRYGLLKEFKENAII
jgi:hypothetical protein